jgi:hypothetical protein
MGLYIDKVLILSYLERLRYLCMYVPTSWGEIGREVDGGGGGGQHGPRTFDHEQEPFGLEGVREGVGG